MAGRELLSFLLPLLLLPALSDAQDIEPHARRPSYELGGPCSRPEDCQFPRSNCSAYGLCECATSNNPFNSSYCGHRVGDWCSDGRCDAPGSLCSKNTCFCPKETVPNSNSTACIIPATQFGDPCSEDADCHFLGDGRLCRAGRCLCQAEFAHDANVCKFKIAQLGAACNPVRQLCFLERDGDAQHAECHNGTCRCAVGFSASLDNQSCSGGSLALASLWGLLLLLLGSRALAA